MLALRRSVHGGRLWYRNVLASPLKCRCIKDLIIFPRLTLRCLTLPSLTLRCLTLPYLTLPYLTLPYLTLPYLTLPYLTLPYLTLPYLTLPYLALPCLTLHITRFNVRHVALHVFTFLLHTW